MTFNRKGTNHGRQGPERQGQEQKTDDQETGQEGKKSPGQGTEKESIAKTGRSFRTHRLRYNVQRGAGDQRLVHFFNHPLHPCWTTQRLNFTGIKEIWPSVSDTGTLGK